MLDSGLDGFFTWHVLSNLMGNALFRATMYHTLPMEHNLVSPLLVVHSFLTSHAMCYGQPLANGKNTNARLIGTYINVRIIQMMSSTIHSISVKRKCMSLQLKPCKIIMHSVLQDVTKYDRVRHLLSKVARIYSSPDYKFLSIYTSDILCSGSNLSRSSRYSNGQC